eukprot:8476362-Heterocapsa_arctica.AAC.1
MSRASSSRAKPHIPTTNISITYATGTVKLSRIPDSEEDPSEDSETNEELAPGDTKLPEENEEPKTILQQLDLFHTWLLRFGYGRKYSIWVEEIHTFQDDMNLANITAIGVLDPQQGQQ